jgi:hypothetical protein
VILYPHAFQAWIPEHDAQVITWRVVAFVDPSDTMFLELKRIGTAPHDWQTIARWNADQDARWSDTTKGVDAWRFGQHIIDATPDTMLLRLRFRSNVTRHSDGFYMDNLMWQSATSVQESWQHVRSVFPQPASEHVMMALTTDQPLASCSLYTLQGAPVQAPWQQHGYTLELDVRGLASGVYVVATHGTSGTSFVHISVVR